MQAFTLACEFMYTAEIEELEDAEVAINVWMVASALVIRDLPRYVHARVLQLLPAAHLQLMPGLFRQALAAWQLSRSSRPEMEEQGSGILQAVLELMMCKLQARTCSLAYRGCVCMLPAVTGCCGGASELLASAAHPMHACIAALLCIRHVVHSGAACLDGFARATHMHMAHPVPHAPSQRSSPVVLMATWHT